MKKRHIIFMLLILLFTVKVNAAESPVINSATLVKDDLVRLNVTKGVRDISAAYVCTDSTLKNCLRFATNSSQPYVSVPNGTYYIVVTDTNNYLSNAYQFTMSTSCFLTGVSNVTGSGNRTMCGVMSSDGQFKNLFSELELASCASGYSIDKIHTQMISTTCKYSSLEFSTYGLSQRLCKNEYKYVCIKNEDTSISIGTKSTLNSLSLSKGSLSPSFASGTYSYAATIDASNVTINATLADTNASFVDGYGPRTVNLNYGVNIFEIKVKGSQTSTYTIKITRPSAKKSSNNTLKSLSLSLGSLSPVFNSYTNIYSSTVAPDVSSVTISAELSDGKSSYVTDFGPRVVKLEYGLNIYYVKVKSESGSVRAYKLNITRIGGDTTNPNPNPNPVTSSVAVLDNITLSSGNIEFESEIFDYNVTVDNDVTTIVPTVTQKDTTDIVEIVGGEELAVGYNEVSIKVTSSDGAVSNIYTIYVVRKEGEDEVSSNSLLKDITIKNHKIKFDAKVTEYKITLNDGENELDLEVEPSSDKASVSIEGNENLTTGSQIKIRVTAENGDTTDYFIEITGYQKGGNVLLTIFLILIIIVVVAYMILRILGYKIYFNVQGLKNLFAKKE